MKNLMKRYGWKEPFFPMNVKNAETKADALFADDNYVAELKRDGSRYICIDGRFFSRKPSENKKTPELLGLPVEKTDNVPHLKEFFETFGKLGIITDGEVFYPGKKSNHTTSIMGCDRDKALMRQGFGEFDTFPAPNASNPSVLKWRLDETQEWQKVDNDSEAIIDSERGKIHYMVFDLLHLHGLPIEYLPWEDRRVMLENWYDDLCRNHPDMAAYISIPPVFEGERAKRTLLKWAEDNDEEGIMFKNKKASYKRGKRPEHHWYRVKGKITADVVIMGYEPPEVEYTGKELANWNYWEARDGGMLMTRAEITETLKTLAYDERMVNEHITSFYTPVTKFYFMGWKGSIVFGLYKDGVLQKAGTCSGMDEEVRKDFTDNGAQYVGSVVEITAMERTEKGLFRHPQFSRFRDDKAATDCLWEVEGAE